MSGFDLLGDPIGVDRKSSTGFTHESASAETVEWYTPEWIFTALGVRFDLDTCAPPAGIPWLPAAKHYALPQNGLELPWEGFVWCNPPYGDEVERWLLRMASHGNGIALVFARTGTGWFHTIAPRCSGILFIKGRVSFVPSQPPPARREIQWPGGGLYARRLRSYGSGSAAQCARRRLSGGDR